MAEVIPLKGKAKPERPGVEQYKKWFEEARDALEDARAASNTDRDYYDGKQWTPEEVATLQRRKQPVQTFNLIRVAVNGMVGVVERGQTDPKAWPRNAPDEQAADLATKTLRFIADQNRIDRLKVKAAKNFFVEGICAVITEVEQEEPDYRIVTRRIPWEEYFFDPYSREEDFSDIRYDGIAKWMDKEKVKEMYGGDEELQAVIDNSFEGPITQSTTYEDRPNSAWTDKKRKRLMVVEMYHQEQGEWRRCVFVKGGVLEYGPSPYLDDKGRPVNPIEKQAYARDRENMPYGAVRDLRSPQDGYNRRQSKLLHALNVRQTFGTKSAVQDVDSVKRELARPDGHVEIEHGEFGRDFGVVPQMDQIAGQFQLLQIAEQQLLRLAPTPAIVGREGQGKSGVALQNEQSAGLTELADAFGGLTEWELRIYRQAWMRAKQFWTSPRWIRVSDDFGAPQYLQVNQQGPNGEAMNGIAELDVDITMDATPESPTAQHEQFQLMGEMVKMGMPIPPEEVIKSMPSLRNKQEIVQGIQQARQMQAQQPNPQIEKLKLDAAAEHERQNLEREKLAQTERIELSRIQAEAVKAQAEAEKARADLELARIKIEIEREKLALERDRMGHEAGLEERRHGLEREKLADGQASRKEQRDAERLKAATDPDEREDVEAEITGQPSRTDRIVEALTQQNQTLVAALTRPKRVVRGPDGRAVGVE